MFAAAKSGGVVSAGDPYWTSVSLLTNFENNLTFQDGSTNNLALTRVGTVNPSLNTPFSGGVGGSEYFNAATGGYLSGPNTTALQMGTGDYTVEFWMYQTNVSTTQVILEIGRPNTSSAPGFQIDTIGGLVTVYGGATTGTLLITAGSTQVVNTWYHIALTRQSNSTKLFINGTQSGSTVTDSTNYNQAYLWVGANGGGGSAYVNGFLSNIRALKGTALYTANFTPPTAPLTAITNTSLLITGTGQGMFDNSTFVDQGPNALTVTATGAPVYSGLSPFGNTYPGSVLFNGTTSYLTTPANTALSMGSSDFTIEGWVYRADTNVRGVFQLSGTAGGLQANTTTNLALGSDTGSVWRIYANNNAYNSTATWSINTWYHFALVRSSGTTTLYISGTSVISQADTVNYTGQNLCVGGFYSTTYLLNGYISNLRIVKGTAVYTANFTPSTTPLTAITNTSLLVRGDTGAFYDLSNNGLAMTANGATAKISVAASKFGTLSTVYDGTQASAINVAISALLAMPGDFTFECWVNVPTVTSQTLYAVIYGSTNTYIESNFAGTNNYTAFGVTPSFNINSGVAAKDSTWRFLTLVRSGTTITFYVDGVNKGTTTTSTAVDLGSPTQARIGAGNNGAADNPFNGYIDSIRITKGVARYTANFTPPTATFPTGP